MPDLATDQSIAKSVTNRLYTKGETFRYSKENIGNPQILLILKMGGWVEDGFQSHNLQFNDIH